MSRPLAAEVFALGVDGPRMLRGSSDPSMPPGLAAPLASQYLRSDGSRWAKVGAADTEWLRSSFWTPSVNGDVVTITAGAPVVISGMSSLLANASSHALSTVVGLSVWSAAPTLPMVIATGTEIVLATATWDAITGQSGGLTPGATYYLAPVAGMLTTTPPSSPGQSVCVVGRALSATEFLVFPQAPIYL